MARIENTVLFSCHVRHRQFWSAYVPCEAQDKNAVQLVFEQIDVIKRMVEKYPEVLQLATTVQGKSAQCSEIRIYIRTKLFECTTYVRRILEDPRFSVLKFR
jgi:hypothetical protein